MHSVLKVDFSNKNWISTITGCPNKFGIGSEMFASEASIVYKKVCISLQKVAFLAFFENC